LPTNENNSSWIKSEINVDLWPSSTWTKGELDQFVDILGEYGTTTGQISSDIRGLEIQTCIAFATGAIAASFFSKLGSDLYDLLKTKLKDLLLKRASRPHETLQPIKVEGRLSFSYAQVELGLCDVYYACRYLHETDLDACLSSVAQLDNIIRSARASELFPFDKGHSFDIYAQLKITQQPSWNVRIRRYIELNGKLVLNEFLSADFDCKELGKSKWHNLNWIQE